jgi:hypothetical protein
MPDGSWMRYTEKDWLPEKAFSQQVPQYGQLTGVLLFTFDELSPDELKALPFDAFTLTFDDGAGQHLQARNEAKSLHERTAQYPGTSPSLIPKKNDPPAPSDQKQI